MRVTLAVAALVLAFASAAHANNPPLAPHTLPASSGFHVITFGTGVQARDKLRSCLANEVSSRTAVGRAARKILPVACEQPPRSQLLVTLVLAGG
jgi:hypothetical protein